MTTDERESYENAFFHWKRLARQVDEAHDDLDWLGVPKEIGGSKLTLSGRLHWLREHVPQLAELAREATREMERAKWEESK